MGDKWVKQQVFPIDFGGKAGVAVVGNFHAILFPFLISGNTGNKREHLVTITGDSSQTFHRILPSGRDLESWWKSFVLAIFSPSRRIWFRWKSRRHGEPRKG
jgi:hypothetical protein